MPMDTLHPEETGAAKLTLQSKVLDHTVYTSSNLVKILILTKGVDFFDTLIFITLVLKAAKQPLTTARSAGEIKA